MPSVALLTESVDWNLIYMLLVQAVYWSLSSRRAWIEIGLKSAFNALFLSRSPHGERGLKFWYALEFLHHRRSLSSRRAWIEMFFWSPENFFRKSLSSRRAWIEIILINWQHKQFYSRSPHGERGLKCYNERGKAKIKESLSSRRAWIEILISQDLE